VVVLKGAGTVVVAPEGNMALNTTGNSGLASGGTGDVLTGIIVGLLAQGLQPMGAACAAVYSHGKAADLAVTECGERGLIAGDVVEHLPAVWQELED
jgi:NAD(P)H-hydrate epimerase